MGTPKPFHHICAYCGSLVAEKDMKYLGTGFWSCKRHKMDFKRKTWQEKAPTSDEESTR